jgi:hypothetical protein
MEWCDKGLALNPDDKVLLELRKSAEELQKTTERDERKRIAKEKKQKKEEEVKTYFIWNSLTFFIDSVHDVTRFLTSFSFPTSYSFPN